MEDRFEDLVSRVEALELMLDSKFMGEVEEGLEDEREGRVVSLDS